MSLIDTANKLQCPHRKQTRVFYVYVGDMTQLQASKHVKNFKAMMDATGLDSFYYENIYIGTREGDNRIEVFP